MSFETVKNSEKTGKTVEELKNESQRTATSGKKESQARTRSLLEKISGRSKDGTGRATISVTSVIDNLNKQLLPRYIMKLEEASEILDAYETELNDVDRKLEKMSAPVRASVGGYALGKVLKQVVETRRKLQVHQEATIERLMRNG